MSGILSMILAGGEGTRLAPLTSVRANQPFPSEVTTGLSTLYLTTLLTQTYCKFLFLPNSNPTLSINT